MQRRQFIGGAALLGAAALAGCVSTRTSSVPDVQGTCAKEFEPVRKAFREAQAADPGGAQLCIYYHGERVVDLWTGRDREKDRPYTADTVTILNSGSKGVTASAVHLLVQRGQIDLNAPVARYWPEFAANGKDSITVATLLAHKGGLSAFPAESGIGAEEMRDWNRCTTTLAAMAPFWQPGTAFRYHATTFGYLAGELVRRVSGKTVGRFIADEFRKPLGLRYWLGDLPEAEEANFAPTFSLRPTPPLDQTLAPLLKLEAEQDSPIVRAAIATANSGGTGPLLNTRPFHLAEIPSSNGISNARSMAKLYAALTGEVDGVRLFNSQTVDRARTLQTAGLGQPPPFDRTPVKHPLNFGIGYELPRSNVAMLGAGSFGHTGAGGRLCFANPERGIAAGYVCNNSVWDALNASDPRWSWTEALGTIV